MDRCNESDKVVCNVAASRHNQQRPWATRHFDATPVPPALPPLSSALSLSLPPLPLSPLPLSRSSPRSPHATTPQSQLQLQHPASSPQLPPTTTVYRLPSLPPLLTVLVFRPLLASVATTKSDKQHARTTAAANRTKRSA